MSVLIVGGAAIQGMLYLLAPDNSAVTCCHQRANIDNDLAAAGCLSNELVQSPQYLDFS